LLAVVLTSVLAGGANVRGLANLAWVGPAAATLVAAVLHPSWRGFFRSFSRSRLNPVTLALVAVVAVPLGGSASTNLWLQGAAPDDPAALGHYGYMAAFSFTVVGLGLLAGLRPDGWRLVAWLAGLLPALLGLASLAYPDAPSGLGPAWSLGAIAWGAAFVAAAELTRPAAPTSSPTTPAPARRATAGAPTGVT